MKGCLRAQWHNRKTTPAAEVSSGTHWTPSVSKQIMFRLTLECVPNRCVPKLISAATVALPWLVDQQVKMLLSQASILPQAQQPTRPGQIGKCKIPGNVWAVIQITFCTPPLMGPALRCPSWAGQGVLLLPPPFSTPSPTSAEEALWGRLLRRGQ